MSRIFLTGALLIHVPNAIAQAPIADPRLARVAADLLLEGLPVHEDALRHALDRHGSDAVGVRTTVAATEADRDRWLGERSEPQSFGEAVGERGRLVVAAPVRGALIIEGFTVRYAVPPDFDDPYLVIRTDALRRRAFPSEGAFLVPELEGAGPLSLQLVAHGPEGPLPLAERRVGSPERRGGSPDLEERLTEHRRNAGVLPVRPNRLLNQVGSRRARGVCGSDRALQHGRGSQGPEARLAEVGLEARLVGEVLARATDLRGAIDGIFDSPSHELTLLDRRLTDMGYGISEDSRGRVCLVVVLAGWPRPVVRPRDARSHSAD